MTDSTGAPQADPTARSLHLSQTLSASAESVFDAWVVPDVMSRWLFASDEGEIVRVDTDPVVGGAFSILERNGGDQIDHFGHYLRVDRPTRLAFTLKVPKHFPETTEVHVEIRRVGEGSVLEFTQTGIDPEKTRAFWETMLDQLADTLEQGA